MAGNTITYNVDFNVKTQGLNKVKSALKDLQNIKFSDLMKINDSSLSEARTALQSIKADADKVENALTKAFNPKLNSINVKTFNQELAKSSMTMNDVYASFSRAGATGEAAFRSLSSQVLNMNLQMKESHAWIDKMATTLANTIKWNVASTAVNILTRSVQQAWGFVKNLDTSLNDIRIVTGKSSDEMAKFAEQANKAAASLGRTTTDYTKAALIFAQQGLSDKQIEARTQITMKTANVTGQSTDAVSEQLTAVWNGYKVNAEQAELYVDRLAAVAATTASNLEELSTGMSKVASAAAAMGVGEEQLAAQLSTIISVTKQAPESVGTALRTVYARISDIKAGIDQDGVDLGRYSGKMAELGFNVLDANGKLRDMGQVIEQIGGKWDYLTREQQISLAQTMAGQRQYSNLIALFDNFEKYNEALNTAQNAAGTLNKQQNIYMDSIKAHLNELTTAVESIWQGLTDPEGLNKIIDALTVITKRVSNLFQGLGGGADTLRLLGTLSLNLFHNQLASGLQTTIRNFGRARQQAENFKAILKTLGETNTKNPYTQDILNNQKNLVEMSKKLSIDEFRQAKESLEDIVRISDKLGFAEEKLNSLSNGFKLGAEGIEDFEKIYGNLEAAMEDDSGYNRIQQNLKDVKENIENLHDQLDIFTIKYKEFKVNLTSGDFTEIETTFNNFKSSLNNIITDDTFQLLPESIRTAVIQANTQLQNIDTSKLTDPAIIAQVNQIYSKVGNIFKNTAKDVNLALKQGQDGFIGAKNAVKEYTGELEKSKKQHDLMLSSFKNVSKGAVDLARGMANLYTSSKQFANLGSIIKDNTISGFSKFGQIVTALGSSLPLFIMGIKNLSSALSFLPGPMGLIVTGISAVVTAFAAFKTASEEADKKIRQQRMAEDKKAAQAAGERIEAIDTQIDSLIELKKQYENNQVSRSQLNDGIKTLLETYSNEEGHLDTLIKQYGSLDQAILNVSKRALENQITQSNIKIGKEFEAVSEKVRGTAEDNFGIPDSKYTQFDFSLPEIYYQNPQDFQNVIDYVLDELDAEYGNKVNAQIVLTNTSGQQVTQEEFLKGMQNLFTGGNFDALQGPERDIIYRILMHGLGIKEDEIMNYLPQDLIEKYKESKNSGKNPFQNMSMQDFFEIINGGDPSIRRGTFLRITSDKESPYQDEQTALYESIKLGQTIIDLVESVLFDSNNPNNSKNLSIDAKNTFFQQLGLTDLSGRVGSEESKTYATDVENKNQQVTDLSTLNNAEQIFEGAIDSLEEYYTARQKAFENAQESSNLKDKSEEEIYEQVDNSIKRYASDSYDQYKQQADFINSLIKNSKIKKEQLDEDKDFYTLVENADKASLKYLMDSILPKYGESIGSLEDFYKLIEDLQKIKIPKATMSLAEASQQYNLYSSLLDQILNSKKQTINKSEFGKLQPDIQQYFRIMADGTYKLTIAAKDFEEVIKEKSLSGLKEVGDSLLERKKIIEDAHNLEYILPKLENTRDYLANGGVYYQQNQNDYSKIVEILQHWMEGSIPAEEVVEKLNLDTQQYLTNLFIGQSGIFSDLSDFINNARLLYNQENYTASELYEQSANVPLRDNEAMHLLDIAQAMGATDQRILTWKTDYVADGEGFSDDIREQVIKFLISTFQNVDKDKIADQFEKQYLATQFQIASSAKNIKQLNQLKEDYDLSDEAVASRQIEIGKQQDVEDLDLNQLQKYTEYIQQIAQDSDLFADSLAKNDQAAQIVAKSIMNMNNGLETLTENWEKWSEILKNNTENTEEYANTITAVQQAVSNLLDISIDYVSKDFIKDHLNLIEEAANGSQDAIDDLRDSLTGEVMLKIALDHDMLESEKQNLINEFSKIQQYAAQITITPGMDESQIVAQMNDLIDKFNLTADQANAALDLIGYEPTFATNEVELPQQSAETATHFEVDKNGGTFQADARILGLPIASISIPAFNMVTEPNGSVDIPGTKISVPSFTGKGNPKIKKVTKKAGGSYSTPSSSKGKKSGGGGGKGGSGGGGGSGNKANTNQKDKKKPLEDERDLYHDINIQINKISKSIDRLQKQQDRLYGKQLLDNLNKQTSLLEQQKEKLKEKQKIQEEDLKNQQEQLKTLGVIFDEYGNIANYMQALGDKQDNINALTDKYNELVASYNASTDSDYKSALEDEMKYYEKTMQQAQEDLSKTKTKIGNYDNLRTAMEDLKDQIKELTQKEIEINIKKFKYELEIRLDMREAAKDWNKFKREVLQHVDVLRGTDFDKIIADARQNQADVETYFHKESGGSSYLEALTKQATDLRTEIEKIDQTGWSDIYGDNKAQAMADLKEDLSSLMDSLEDIHSLIDNIDEAYLDTIDDIENQWDKQIEDYEFVNELLQHNIDLVNLLYGDKNYQAMDSYYQQMHNNSLKELESLANRRDLWKKLWDEAVESGESVAAQKFKENWMNTVKEINDMVKQSIETLKDQYENTINSIFDKMNRGLTNGKGLDYLGFEWDLMNEKADDYLDTINSAFAIQQTERKYQKAINDTKSIKNQKALRDLMDQQLTLLQNKQKVTQYDVDRAEKLLQVEQARIALEDMRSAKTNLRLKRDSQGNYSYQYHADNDAISEAEDNLAAAKNELYNFDLAAYKTNLDELYNLWKEYTQKYKEINLDASLSDEERQERLDELTQKYGDRINLRLEQNTGIRNNLYESAFQEYTNLYENNLQNFDQMLNSEDGMVPMWTSGIQQMADKMNAEGGFLPVTQEALAEVEEETNRWKEKIEETADVAGVRLDEIGQGVDETTEKFGTLIEANDELLNRFMAEEQAAAELKNYLENLAEGYAQVYNEAAQAVGQLYNFVHAQEQAAAAADATATAYESMINRMQSANAAYMASPYQSTVSVGGDSGSGGSGSGSGGGSGNSSINGNKTINQIIEEEKRKQQAQNTSKIYASGAKDWAYISYNDRMTYATGGYTGDWNSSQGRPAILHEKELVLNQKDTENLLNTITILRNMMNNVGISTMSRMGNIKNRSLFSSEPSKESIEQNVKIDANFPNVNSKREIEEAFDNLVNLAAQRVLR